MSRYLYIPLTPANLTTIYVGLGANCGNCDNCIAALKARFCPLTEWQHYIWKLSLQVKATPPKLVKPRAPRRKGLRRTERREFVLNDLKTFRYKYWLSHHSRCAWGPESLIPDKTAAFLATNGGIRTIEDLKIALPDWGFCDDIGKLVLARMDEADDRWFVSEGKVNPNKVPKVVETKRQAADRYNANKREKRRKLREESSLQEDSTPPSLDVAFFVPGTTKFIGDASQVEVPLPQLSVLPVEPSQSPLVPVPQDAQLVPLAPSKALSTLR